MNIKEGKFYDAVLTDGTITSALILATSAVGVFPVLVRLRVEDNYVVVRFTEDGTAESNYGVSHLLSLPTCAEWPVDAKVVVWEDPQAKMRRHFACVKNGVMYAWSHGKTSWTARNGETTAWNNMRRRYVEEDDATSDLPPV